MVPSMGTTNNHKILSNTENSDNPLEKIIEKYKNHPSISCINKHTTSSTCHKKRMIKKQYRQLLSI